MTVSPWVYYLGTSAVIGVASRLWVIFRRDRRARRSFAAPLVPTDLLDQVLAPREGDDPNIAAELREVLGHLNRQTYAEEFWRVDEQLAAYYARLPKSARPTMRAIMLRLLEVDDRWLRVVAAKTSARIGLAEACELIHAALDRVESKSDSDVNGQRYASELRAALDKLRPDAYLEK